MHGCFDGDGFPVARWPVEDDPPLPGDAQRDILGAGVEEAVYVGDEFVLERGGEDDIGPVGGLDGLVEGCVFLPEAPVEDPDLAVQVIGPFAGGDEEALRGGGGADEVGVLNLGEGIKPVAPVGDVEREFVGRPGVEVSAVENHVQQAHAVFSVGSRER